MPPKKLLLVEDDPNHAFLTQIALERTGFEHDLVIVKDGVELLEYLFRQGRYTSLKRHDMPDLIFLDLQMPHMDGFEVLSTLKGDGRSRAIPIVMLSSSGEHSDVKESYRLGANSYVCKRVNADEFQQTLKDLLAYWFTFVTLPRRICLEPD